MTTDEAATKSPVMPAPSRDVALRAIAGEVLDGNKDEQDDELLHHASSYSDEEVTGFASTPGNVASGCESTTYSPCLTCLYLVHRD